jgi:hypothetical protein
MRALVRSYPANLGHRQGKGTGPQAGATSIPGSLGDWPLVTAASAEACSHQHDLTVGNTLTR